jgi:hypothetical protein
MFKNTCDKKEFFNYLKCDLEKVGYLHTLKFIIFISKYRGITSKDDSITNWVENITNWVKNIADWVKNSKGLLYCVQIIIEKILKMIILKMLIDLLFKVKLKKEFEGNVASFPNSLPEFKSKKYNFEEEIALFLRNKLEGELQIYIEATISNIKEKGNNIKDKIKNNKSVFLVGAGLSYGSGIPLTNELDDILKKVGAKNYKDLEDNEKVRKFKEEFAKICDKASPGISHKLIARNFPKYIKEIICLNWDNLIEKAYFEEHNKEIEKIYKDGTEVKVKVKDINEGGYLWKFHGDVDNQDHDWIFPNHEGRVFDNFKNYLKNNQFLQSGQFVFVIVGYSEKEKNIVDNVIKILENTKGGTTRIGLNPSKIELGLELEHLHDQNYIFGPADFVLEHILPINSKLF